MSTPRWILVWCHERCQKIDMEPYWQALVDGVESANGTSIRFKKAVGLEKWLAHAPLETPLALLADWRETKPCLQVLKETRCGRPVVTLVCTKAEKQLRLASKWVLTLLPEVSERVLLVPPSSDAEAVVKLGAEWLLKPPPTLKLSVLLGCGTVEKKLWQQPPWSSAADHVGEAGTACPEKVVTFMQMQSSAWCEPVSHVLSSVIFSASSKDVHDMLMAALPEVYSD